VDTPEVERVIGAPKQAVAGVVDKVNEGTIPTFAIVVADIVQPLLPVPTTVYTVLVFGWVVLYGGPDKVGLKVYELPPDGVKVMVPPAQTSVAGDLVIVILGSAKPVTIMVSLDLQPFTAVVVNTYCVLPIAGENGVFSVNAGDHDFVVFGADVAETIKVLLAHKV
jgi:hypothetical protein